MVVGKKRNRLFRSCYAYRWWTCSWDHKKRPRITRYDCVTVKLDAVVENLQSLPQCVQVTETAQIAKGNLVLHCQTTKISRVMIYIHLHWKKIRKSADSSSLGISSNLSDPRLRKKTIVVVGNGTSLEPDQSTSIVNWLRRTYSSKIINFGMIYI